MKVYRIYQKNSALFPPPSLPLPLPPHLSPSLTLPPPPFTLPSLTALFPPLSSPLSRI